jgi:hypothetical protein
MGKDENTLADHKPFFICHILHSGMSVFAFTGSKKSLTILNTIYHLQHKILVLVWFTTNCKQFWYRMVLLGTTNTSSRELLLKGIAQNS